MASGLKSPAEALANRWSAGCSGGWVTVGDVSTWWHGGSLPCGAKLAAAAFFSAWWIDANRAAIPWAPDMQRMRASTSEKGVSRSF